MYIATLFLATFLMLKQLYILVLSRKMHTIVCLQPQLDNRSIYGNRVQAGPNFDCAETMFVAQRCEEAALTLSWQKTAHLPMAAPVSTVQTSPRVCP